MGDEELSLPLDELYFTWLYSRVCSATNKNPRRSYWGLLRLLYKTEYRWQKISMDENRAEDGRDLRLSFLRQYSDQSMDVDWMELPCSFLEFLIALSDRAAFESSLSRSTWFWTMLDNLGLATHNDISFKSEIAERRLQICMDREYDEDGIGGLFPLDQPMIDQRYVEVWYQLAAYILEKEV